MRGPLSLENKSLDPDFCRWAFGCELDKRWESAEHLLEAWNQRHGDKLILNVDGNIHEDICRMGGLWALEGYPDGK